MCSDCIAIVKYINRVRSLLSLQVMVDTENTTLVQVPLRSSVIYSLDFNITFKEDLGYLA